MIDPLFFGFERLQDIIIPENSITNAADAINFIESMIGMTDNYVVSILTNPAVNNQLLSIEKLIGGYINNASRRYRDGGLATFSIGPNYDLYIVQGTKYAVYKTNYATVVNPYS